MEEDESEGEQASLSSAQEMIELPKETIANLRALCDATSEITNTVSSMNAAMERF